MYEAQQAFFYGLNPSLALASVTSTPAAAAGLGHRIGTLREGKRFRPLSYECLDNFLQVMTLVVALA